MPGSVQKTRVIQSTWMGKGQKKLQLDAAPAGPSKCQQSPHLTRPLIQSLHKNVNMRLIISLEYDFNGALK